MERNGREGVLVEIDRLLEGLICKDL